MSTSIQNQDMKELAEAVLGLIPQTTESHNREHGLHVLFNKILRSYFSNLESDTLEIQPFSGLVWPHVSLGRLDSYATFTMEEMVTYVYYWINRNRYKTFFDVGSNTGIDSVIVGRLGLQVYSFEPDPENFELLKKNVALNHCSTVHPYQKAASNVSGDVLNFVRVKGNLTANHVAGARDFYGDSETFQVTTMKLSDVGVWPDLMKINIEGCEKYVVQDISPDVWRKIDCFIEIHDQDNRDQIFAYLRSIDMNIFSQKIGWKMATSLEEMPQTNKEGYVFVSAKPQMNWQAN